MPEEDIPEGKKVIASLEDIEYLTDKKRDNIRELFENMEVTHEFIACSCGLLGMMSQSFTSRHLLLLMKASVHPLVQVNTMASFMEEPATSRGKVDLTESRPECVKLMMVLDPASKTITKEKINSPMHLLAATFMYKVLYKFADGVTQCKIQEMYFIRPKQLAAYMTSSKYMDGTDRKVWARKRKISRDDEEPFMSKNTAME